jgi:predicted PurR-regulated permease PerM
MRQRGALIFLSVVVALLLPFLLQIALPFITPFILASVLAIMLNPVKEWLRLRIHRPAAAAALTTFAAVSILGIFLAVVGITLTGELMNAYNALSQRSLEEGGWPALAARTTDRIVDSVATRIPTDKEAIRTELIDRMKNASAYLLRNAGVAVGGMTSAIITFLLVTLFLYFLLRYGSDWVARLASLAPLHSHISANIIRAMRDSVLANLNGMLAVIIGQGLLLSIGFWIAGIQSPVLWGAIGGLASIIPVVGALIIWAPVAIAFLLAGAYWKAAFLGLWGFLIVGSADNILRPWVIGKREKQPPTLIALAAIGGTYAFGGIGIILGPMLVSLIAVLLNEIQHLINPNDATGLETSRIPNPRG